MVDDIDRAVEAVGKTAANSNKGALIVTWSRITSGFISNCSAVHLLKPQHEVAALIGRYTLAR
jgi:hypothetical protein